MKRFVVVFTWKAHENYVNPAIALTENNKREINNKR